MSLQVEHCRFTSADGADVTVKAAQALRDACPSLARVSVDLFPRTGGGAEAIDDAQYVTKPYGLPSHLPPEGKDRGHSHCGAAAMAAVVAAADFRKVRGGGCRKKLSMF